MIARTSSHVVEVSCDRADAFEFLSDLENHWQLLPSLVRAADTSHAHDDGPVLQAAGATSSVLILKAGRIPISRLVQTQLDQIVPVELLTGTAKTADSVARVRWDLSVRACDGGLSVAQNHSTVVKLTVIATPKGFVDTLLYTLGRPWLARQYQSALTQLRVILEADRDGDERSVELVG